MRKHLLACALVAAALAFASPGAGAGVIGTGTPTTNVPPALVDDLGTLSDPLPDGEFLVPIEVSGANVLQGWSFDLLFDASVAAPIDAFGLYGSVYPAHFNAADPTVSGITSGGFGFPAGTLAGIAGFSGGVSGDGLLAFVLFAYEPGHAGGDPQLAIANATLDEQPAEAVPEPQSLVLVIVALVAGAAVTRRRMRLRSRVPRVGRF